MERRSSIERVRRVGAMVESNGVLHGLLSCGVVYFFGGEGNPKYLKGNAGDQYSSEQGSVMQDIFRRKPIYSTDQRIGILVASSFDPL